MLHACQLNTCQLGGLGDVKSQEAAASLGIQRRAARSGLRTWTGSCKDGRLAITVIGPST